MVSPSQIYEEILEAYDRIKGYIRKTPLESSPYLSDSDRTVYLKLENMQFMGSFKTRGAFNKLLTLEGQEVITASTGNHGMSTAYALDVLGGSGKIFLPNGASETKIKRLNRFSKNAKLEFHGEDSVETEIYARSIADNEDMEFISPYNDEKIIAGQGTIGVELKDQISEIENIFITVGGGGLISGIASYLRKEFPKCRIIGCLPENSPVMYKSVKAGHVIVMESLDTISDGSAGGLEKGSITFDLCKELIDEFVLVSEFEIKNAMKDIFEEHRLVIEGAAGVAVASFNKIKDKIYGNSVIILCGGNIDIDTFKEIVF